MTEAATVNDSDSEFDAAWDDDPKPKTEVDEFTTHTDDDAKDDTPKADQDADQQKDSDDKGVDEVAQLKADLEKERQRVRSAEGRFNKFASDVEVMRARQAELEAKLAEKDKPAAKAEAPEDAGYDNPNADLDPEFNKELTRRAQLAEQRALEKAEAKIAEATKGQDDRLAKLEQERQQEREQKALEQFENAIRAQVPEYDALTSDESVEELDAFIAAQSPVLQRAYRQTIDNGTVEEVVDLLSAFKSHKSESDKSQQREVERKADAAAAVPSRSRAAIPKDKQSKAYKDDFDAGWDEAK